MQKTILLTGATDGIGLETSKAFVGLGHKLLIHGRNPAKLKSVSKALSSLTAGADTEYYVADLSDMAEVKALAKAVAEKYEALDVLINNAGVFRTPEPVLENGLDVRFAVNTIAPYLLTQRLLPLLGKSGRVINLSSAAQAPVDPEALVGRVKLPDGEAYAQSKLAITMWSRSMALSLSDDGPSIIAVNPRSMLGSKMVKQAYGVAGGDLRIGAEILCRATLSDEFAAASGQYFDNDIGQFASPHPDALNTQKCEAIVRVIEAVLAEIIQ
jgi:NAD(P)-dependent dehydrogenase (short-subunit alcohol dehydrogenase family)